MKPFLEKRAAYIFLLITIIVTTTFHFWRLPDFPAAVSGDEADNGLEVMLLMAEPELIAFAPSNAGREAMFHYMLMLPIAIFGPTIFALRFLPTLAGILIVPLTYRWLRALLPRSSQRNWIAILAAMFVATSLWELHLSRLGLRGVLLIPCMLTAYYFFWRGYRSRRYRWFIFSGLFLGLAVHTYTASRSLPLAFILFTLALFLYRQQSAGRIWRTWQGLILTGLTSLVVFAPLGWYFLNYPGAFIFRSDQVSLWSTYQSLHAHTGQSFPQFVFQTWGENIRWFVEVSTPWLQNDALPTPLQILPLFFWIGLIWVIWEARHHVGYAFLLIAFGLGILPIFIGQATTMRIVLALPATYAVLALGVSLPVMYLLKHRRNLSLPLNSGVAVMVLLISTIATAGTFRVEQWLGAPPLPTLFDHAFHTAAEKVKTLVLEQRQSVLVPQAVYTFPPAFYLMQADFPSPLPVEDQRQIAPTETVAIFWPVAWEQWFQNKPPSFVLLSPGAADRFGYVETVGQWEPARFADFRAMVETQRAEAETVVDKRGQLIGHIIQADRAQIASNFRSTPQTVVNLSFNDEITLLGYDTWFLSDHDLDVGLFWQARQNILEDHHLVLQVVDRHGTVWGETLASFDAPTAAWFPGQLMIDHKIIPLPQKLQSGSYVLKVGLIKANYKDEILTKRGEWMAVVDSVGRSQPGPLVPVGLLQIGDPPLFNQELMATFADKISLTGYHLAQGATSDEFQISLRWQALKPIEENYTVTLQLFDQNQNLVAQVDKPPLGGAYPTTAWPFQEPIVDTYDLRLPEELENGVYHLAVGLYDFETSERLPVSQADTTIVDDTLVVIHKISLNSGMETSRRE